MEKLDTAGKWKPKVGRPLTDWSSGAPAPKGHQWPRDAMIDSGPGPARAAGALDDLDIWAAVLNLSDYGAFTSLGPAGDGAGVEEPARLWQDVLNTLQAAATAHAVQPGDTRPLDKPIREAIAAGDLYRGWTRGARPDDGGMVARDGAPGHRRWPELGTCVICGRRMVRWKTT